MKNRFPVAGSGWSWPRLCRVAGAVFVGQVVILFVLSRPSVSPALLQQSRPRLVPLVWESPHPQDGMNPLLPDPVTFARVVPEGFSGALWLSPGLTELLKPEPALPLVGSFGRGEPILRPRLDRGPLVPDLPDQVVGVPVRIPPPPRPRLLYTNTLGLGRSILRLREGGTGWQPVLSEPLPVWTNAQLLAPSVVQVLVDPQGGVLSATVEQGSGLPEADQEALKRARRLRFAPPVSPATNEGSLWAHLEFVWFTVSPGQSPTPSP